MAGEITETCRELVVYEAELGIRVGRFGLVVGPSSVTSEPPLTRLASATVMQCPSQPFRDSASVTSG